MNRNADDVWGFFLIAHGWSWWWWGMALLRGGSVWDWPNESFLYIGGLGPLLAGLIMSMRRKGWAGLVALWRRLIEYRRIGPLWLLVILGLPPLLNLMALAIDQCLNTTSLAVELRPLAEVCGHPLDLLGLALFILILGPLPEEIGWRGYALDALQRRWSALTASLILGLAWAVWHLPLFYMADFYTSGGRHPPSLLPFVYNVVLTAVLMTWIYNNTRRSLLGAVLFHFMTNLSGELLPLSGHADTWKTLMTSLLVLCVVHRWGAATMVRNRTKE